MWWRWKCLNANCGREFVKEAGFVINLRCRYCGNEETGFLKIAEQKTKSG